MKDRNLTVTDQVSDAVMQAEMGGCCDASHSYGANVSPLPFEGPLLTPSSRCAAGPGAAVCA